MTKNLWQPTCTDLKGKPNGATSTNNNAAPIRIFIKGLRNAHTLASHVYEKGTQTPEDAISEVEKLQAVQQLTTTLLPSSTVNVMSSEDDKCFPVSRIGTHGTPLPTYMMFQLR